MHFFQKAKFNAQGEYVSYEGKFVARFKYNKGGKGAFISFLIKNFTVEEYFGRLDQGMAPLQILKTKGYIEPHVRKMLRQLNLPETMAGVKMLLNRQVAQVRALAA